MTYAVGQTIEVCLDVRLPPARGIRRVMGVFVNEHGESIELTDVPARASQCVLQDPSQTALWGHAAHPGVYKLRRLEVKDLRGVTRLTPPEVSFEVVGAPEVAQRRPA